MRRRTLFRAGIALAAGHGIALAQPSARKPRIGFLGSSTPDPLTLRTQAEPLRQGLREAGWVEGQNLAPIEFRWGEGKYERFPVLLDELLRLDLDLLITVSPRPALLAKEVAPKTLPIVALAVDDPVKMGLVPSIARPGGNLTGVSAAFEGLVEKRLQLLKDIVPAARRFAFVFNPASVPPTAIADLAPGWGQTLGVAITPVEIRSPEDFEAAFAAMAKDRVDGIVFVADPMIWAQRARLGELTVKQRLPSVWGGSGYLEAGGIASYQGDWPAVFRRGAALVDKILRGAKPGDLPFEQGTKLELAVNPKVARAIGVTIPQSVLLQADVVIE
ncbi:MAG: ABC transporter substrate-binding protein [Burkholderiaceae bacterium]|nr:ABC transporter substrate-binding protein [Burkholderiaceae bacterium]